MAGFLNRKRELTALRKSLDGSGARLLVMYGRRRVGKTALLVEFASKRDALVYTAEQSTESILLDQLSSVAASAAKLPHLSQAPFRHWEAFFEFLATWAAKTPRLVILDEFPYMMQSTPALASKLQKAWDHSLRHTSLRLVLCGSHVSVMEQEVLGSRSPLYGRRTGQMRVGPLDFFEARLFLEGLSPVNQVEAYAILGGVPAYLSLYEPGRDLFAFIKDEVLRLESFLHDEPRFLLLQEIREPRNYFAILRSLASGDTRLNDVVQHSGLDRSVVSRYLDILRSMGLVERETPVTEIRPDRTRTGLYRISDPFLRFWFRFVYPNATELEAGRLDAVLERRIRPDFSSFVAPLFEEVSRQWIRRVEGTRRWPETYYESLGRWWDRVSEVDIVGVGNEGSILLGECKWSEQPVGINVLDELVEKCQGLIAKRPPDKVTYVIFSKTGFTAELMRRKNRNVRLITLDDMVLD